MIYSFRDLKKKGETQYSVRRKVESGKLIRLQRGYYSDDPNEFGSEANYCKKYPNAILTGYTAFYLYDLTDGIPDRCYLATPRNAVPINDPSVKQTYQNLDIINVGVTVMETDSGLVRIYDLERTLIELIRLRSKCPSDLYYEVLSSFRARKDELDFTKVYDYLASFKNGKALFQKIKEAMV